jgi:hypothetical protein
MGLNYERMHDKVNKPISENEKQILYSKDFPECKGLYPDCPKTPSLDESMCKTCPKTEGLKKPKQE